MNAVRSLTNYCLRHGPCRSIVSVTRPGLVQLYAPLHGNRQSVLVLDQQQRFISKYISKSARKRLPLTTKRAGKGYYKGNGSTKEGRLTSKGKFVSDPKKKLELMAPDLEGFNLKPYIARTATKIAPELRRRPGQV
uniref:Uncharacterized protein n=1 Tax=Pseudo-nitzschia australis TaxID=44445 RepID=A0A7S4A9E0_9STRA|mmetsp:Transcript_9594/g.20771  ORF Transcript_9594/g.20771 Transcript_9594/m.20771 type:complete len:136 (+) Transcript_9594:258-665(+)